MDEDIKCYGNLYGGRPGGNYAGNVYDVESISPTLTTMSGGNRQPMILEKGDEMIVINDRGFKDKAPQVSFNEVPTLRAEVHGNQPKVVVQYRIRRLTPKECWRLMGFTDEQFDRAREVNSDTQLYREAGNSIVVDCLAAIFNSILQTEKGANT